jgi:hypothetical protein
MPDEKTSNPEVGGMVAQLKEAGLVESYERADGTTAHRLTDEGQKFSDLLDASEASEAESPPADQAEGR